MELHKVFVDGRLVLRRTEALTQPEIREICEEYNARFTNMVYRTKTYYKGFSQVEDEITEYTFTGVKNGRN